MTDVGDFSADTGRFATSAAHPHAHRALAKEGLVPVRPCRSLSSGSLLIGLLLALLWALLWTPAAWSGGDDFTTAMNAVTVRVLCRQGPESLTTGSGFIVGEGLYTVTNWHVVACTADGGQAAVLLGVGDHGLVAAAVQVFDESRDLAILRLARRAARPNAGFATAATLRQRDPVIAVGFPGDADDLAQLTALADATMTVGVVGRLLPPPVDPSQGPWLVQVSAAINPGNSGGPLFDELGRVVGVNTLKAQIEVPTLGDDGEVVMRRVPSGEGLGWAVLSDSLLPMLDRLGIAYPVSSARGGVWMRFWQRERGWAVTLILVALMGLGGLALMATGRGRILAGNHLRQLRPLGPSQRRPPPAPVPILRGLSGPYAGQVIPLSAGAVAVGRDPALVQLVLPQDQTAISQRHALIGYDRERADFVVEDCWSTNGVHILHDRGKTTTLTPGRAHHVPAGTRLALASPAIVFEVALQ